LRVILKFKHAMTDSEHGKECPICILEFDKSLRIPWRLCDCNQPICLACFFGDTGYAKMATYACPLCRRLNAPGQTRRWTPSRSPPPPAPLPSAAPSTLTVDDSSVPDPRVSENSPAPCSGGARIRPLSFAPSVLEQFFRPAAPSSGSLFEQFFGSSAVPSFGPSAVPGFGPSAAPSFGPSAVPSTAPSFGPSAVPSFGPSAVPSTAPGFGPSAAPSFGPSAVPSTLRDVAGPPFSSDMTTPVVFIKSFEGPTITIRLFSTAVTILQNFAWNVSFLKKHMTQAGVDLYDLMRADGSGKLILGGKVLEFRRLTVAELGVVNGATLFWQRTLRGD